MERALVWTIEKEEDVQHVTLSGELTENANLATLVVELTSRVVFDLSAIQRVNSPGVREWITFLNALNRTEQSYALERCSVSIVNQLNMISNFRGNGNVLSVFAPYYCSRCSRDEKRLVDLSKPAAEQIAAPFPCPACGDPMEFDDIADAFLAFAGA